MVGQMRNERNHEGTRRRKFANQAQNVSRIYVGSRPEPEVSRVFASSPREISLLPRCN